MIFHFDASAHRYTDAAGQQLPSVTQLLELSGWQNTEAPWYTAEVRERGHRVHELCAAYDWGTLDARQCDDPCRGYLMAYVKAVELLRPSWAVIEEPFIHPKRKFCGRPDRVGAALGAGTVAEIKSGCRDKAHAVQLALQKMLIDAQRDDPRWFLGVTQRLVIYVAKDGRVRVVRASELMPDSEADREAERALRKAGL